MDSFLINITSFPTAIFTTGLVVVLGFWLVSLLGMFDLDLFSVDVDIDAESSTGDIGTFAGLLTTLGLNGVPITIVITMLILNSWFICYFAVFLTPGFAELLSILRILIDMGIVVVSFAIAIPLTAVMIRPLRPIFKRLDQEPLRRSLIGATCRVRSSRVDNDFGEGECLHYGASLIVKIRSLDKKIYATGESVCILEHLENDDTFTVVSHKEFEEQLK